MQLVALHPLPLDGTTWPRGLETLADGFVAPTLYSAGDDIRSWARAVLDTVAPGPMALVGSSIGGSVALEIARLAPERVGCIVLSGAKAGHRPEPELRDEALRVLLDDGIDEAWARYWAPLFGPDAPDDVVARCWRVAAAHGAAAIAAGVRAFHGRPDRAAFLASWAGPVWIVCGQHDLHPVRARRLAASLANGRYREVRRAGHYVPLEAPAAFTAIVAEALDDSRRHQAPR